MSEKYLVVSDNHGNMRNLKSVIKHFKGEIRGIIHCGDVEYSIDRIEDFAGCSVYGSRGNCDFYFEREDESLLELGDRHVALVTHGDRYGVSFSFSMLLERAQELGADVVFYGHTHRPAWHEMNYDDQVLTVMNPGSIELPRQFQPSGPTFATLEVGDDGRLTPHFYLIDRAPVMKFYEFDIQDYEMF